MNWRRHTQALPSLAAAALFVLMFGSGSIAYKGFFSGQVFLNLLVDNAYLQVVALGMCFVILGGGIDLSVGSVVALTTMLLAWGVQSAHLSPWVLVPLLVAGGAAFGAAMGWVIQRLALPAFIVTLAGMFLARGLCYLISVDSIAITDPTLSAWSQARWAVPLLGEVSPGVVVALLTLAAAVWVAHGTSFGRTVYAMGGNERSAQLMGLPVARTRIAVHAICGGCAALGGVIFGTYTLSGYGLNGLGLELEAIAAVVIGGALLTGGVGYVAGTLTGVLLLGVIQTLIIFDGSLSSWWTRIAIGAMLGLFCILQRVFELLPRASPTAPIEPFTHLPGLTQPPPPAPRPHRR